MYEVRGEVNVDIRSKVLYLDVETTGLDPETSEIWQLAGRFAHVGFDGKRKVVKEFNYFIKPTKPVSQEIYDNKDQLPTGPEFFEDPKFEDAEIVFAKFSKFIMEDTNSGNFFDKYMICAHNADFDYRFLRAFWTTYNKGDKKTGFGYYIWWIKLNTVDLLGIMNYLGIPRMPRSFKIESLCRHYQIDGMIAHDALSDITATEALVDKFLQSIRSVLVDNRESYLEKLIPTKGLNYVIRYASMLSDELFFKFYNWVNEERMRRLTEIENNKQLKGSSNNE